MLGLNTTTLTAGSKVFLCGELKEQTDFFKSIESSFKEITDLENDIELKLELTEPSTWADSFKKGTRLAMQDIPHSLSFWRGRK